MSRKHSTVVTPAVHSSLEKLYVTHDTMRSHPNTVCHIRRFESQHPTRDSVVAQRTLSTEAIVLIRPSIRASIATARFSVHPTETLVVVCPGPCWHGSNKNDGMKRVALAFLPYIRVPPGQPLLQTTAVHVHAQGSGKFRNWCKTQTRRFLGERPVACNSCATVRSCLASCAKTAGSSSYNGSTCWRRAPRPRCS